MGGNIAARNSAEMKAHIANDDPHQQYAKANEVDTAIGEAVKAHVEQADPHEQYAKVDEVGTAIGEAVKAHVKQADPHQQYAKADEVGTAIGEAVKAHVEQADPHQQYAKVDEVGTAIGEAVKAHVEQTDPHQQYAKADETSKAIGEAVKAHAELDDPHQQYAKADEVSTAIANHKEEQSSHKASTIAISVIEGVGAANVQAALDELSKRQSGGGGTGGVSEVSWLMESANVYNLGQLAPYALAYWDMPSDDIAIVQVVMWNPSFSISSDDQVDVSFSNKDGMDIWPRVKQWYKPTYGTQPIFVPPGTAVICFQNASKVPITVSVQSVYRLKGATFNEQFKPKKPCLLYPRECPPSGPLTGCRYYPRLHDVYECTKEKE
ncbi:MAG: hypothetical protein ACRCWP_04145 [Shewanella sp.]